MYFTGTGEIISNGRFVNPPGGFQQQMNMGQQSAVAPQFMNLGYGYNQQPQQFMNPPQMPVPPVIDAYGNVSGPSEPGYHDIRFPQYQNQAYGFSQMPNPNYPYFTGNSIYSYQQPDPYQTDPYRYHGSIPALNPALRPQITDRVVNVPGIILAQNPLITQQDINKVHELYDQMVEEQDEYYDRTEENPYQYNYNYYGQNAYWGAIGIQQKYDAQVQAILNEAARRRIDWSKRLSRIAHSYLGDGIGDEEINRMYDGYTYTIPGAKIEEDNMYDILLNATPINPGDPNLNVYARHSMEVNHIYESLVPPNCDMNTFFGKLHLIDMFYEYTAETSRRRNTQRLFDSTGYRALIRKSKKNRKFGLSAEDRLVDQIKSTVDPNASTDKQMIQAASIAESMMLGKKVDPETESMPFGTMLKGMEKYGHFENGVFTIEAPDWFSEPNELENEYDAHRDAFIKSIYNTEK